MMIKSNQFNTDVYIADFTKYNQAIHDVPASVKGVYIDVKPNEIIPSFRLKNKNKHPFVAINLEENKSLFKREDGTLKSQCECIMYALRKEIPSWMVFLELKYCEPKNRYDETLEAISQLKRTYKHVFEKQIFDKDSYKFYFVVSTPGVEPLDPFDDTYFNQDDMLTLKEEFRAQLFLANQLSIHTPKHICNI